jgi:hypothetical protein
MSKLTALALFAAVSAQMLAGDLSKYREFQFGTSLSTVAKQTGGSPTQAKVVQRRPALIEEFQWRPQTFGSTAKSEPVQEIVFSFYDSLLFRIVVNYDRYETEGLTAEDIIETLSVKYGAAVKPAAAGKSATGTYGDPEDAVALWQDAQYRFELIRSSYGPSYKLVGVSRKLEAPAQASIVEAARLDDKEAPQREADQTAKKDETERVKLEKARLANKPKFRP